MTASDLNELRGTLLRLGAPGDRVDELLAVVEGVLQRMHQEDESNTYDVEPFRQAFELSGMSQCELARRLSWVRPDHGRVARTLGLVASTGGDRPEQRQRIGYELAQQLAKALNVDPREVGL